MSNILLIDDRADFANGFLLEANSKSLNVSWQKSFAGLQETLPKFEHKFAAVILDIRCLLKDDQEKEDASFITVALGYLDRHMPLFPRFILTGDDHEFDRFRGYFIQEKVFQKTPGDVSRLMDELQYCVANNESLSIKRKYSQVFEIFTSGKMNNVAEVQLLKIIQQGLSETKFENFKGILADVRSFQEALYKSLRDRNPVVVPLNMFQPNGMIKFRDLMAHLNGYPDNRFNPTRTVYQNQTISNLTSSLYWSCGEYIHEDPNRVYFISEYALKSLVYNLLELTIWANKY